MIFIAHPWTHIKYAWSIRFNIIAGILILIEPLIQGFVSDVTFESPYIRSAVRTGIGLFNLAAIWAKLTYQPKLQQKIAEKVNADLDKEEGGNLGGSGGGDSPGGEPNSAG